MDCWNLESFDVKAVWNDALRILGEIGLRVPDDRVVKRVGGSLLAGDGCVRFPAELVEHYAAEIRERASAYAPAEGRRKLSMYNSTIHSHYLDAATGETRPHTTQSLASHLKFIRSLAEDGVYSGHVPGYPLDVPPALQFLTAYYVECLYHKTPAAQCFALSLEAARYNLEITNLMGLTLSISAEPLSPLKFAGESINIALELHGPGVSVHVDPMPIMGITAPMDWHAAWAQSVAENLGAYIIFRLCGVEDVWPSLRLFVPNMATGMAYFTSPKHLLALLTRRKVHEFFGIHSDWAELLLVSSKAPDQQAAAEKAAGCVAGALFGYTNLEGAGALCLDEVFSAEQLMLDIEILDYVRAMIEEMPRADVDAVDEVRTGTAAGSFFGSDLTLSAFRDYIWRPRLFDLSTRAGWSGVPILEKAAKPSVEERAAAYTYELADARREELERIMARARRELA